MARKKSGAFSKILNFIGLVDDEDSRDTYGEEYSAGNYGRQSAYTPARSTRSSAASRQSAPRRTATERSRYETPRYDESPRSRYSASRDSRTPGYDDYRTPERRTPSRFEDDYSYPARTQQRAPRASQGQDARYDRSLPQPGQRQQTQRAVRVTRRTRTVMYSLRTLKDCCNVINEIIANNTVVLTMEELEGHMMQRALDTLSGAAFALDASLRKASDKTYLITPKSVEVNEVYDTEEDF